MIPTSYLQLTLADVLALHSTVDQSQPVPLRRLTAALRRLERQLAKQQRARAASDRRWLLEQFEALTTSPPAPRAARKARK